SLIVIISNTLTVSFPYRKFGGMPYNRIGLSEALRSKNWAEGEPSPEPHTCLLNDPRRSRERSVARSEAE
ncbi:MAG TPA: hypothetical protein C5S37_05675, partial [Methanophagales archaeon]|nr:hypothetical protein [Methanophagales archaeon]